MVFWTKVRRDDLRNALHAVFETLDLNAKHVDDFVRIHAREFGIRADKRTIQRFMSGEVKTRDINLSAVLVGLAKGIKQYDNLPKTDLEKLSVLFELYAQYMAQDQDGATTVQETVPPLHSLNESVAALSDKILAYLHLPEGSSENCASYFFTDKRAKQAHFVCYRYSGVAGYVQKSFTVVHRPTPEIPLVRFANYFEFEGRKRASAGIVLRFGRDVTFWGQSDKGESSKTFVFNNISVAQNRYFGLMLTGDPDQGPMASRFVMKRTKIDHHNKITTGRINRDEAAKELGDDSLARIRNRIPFVLEQDVIDSNGITLTQTQMVGRVADALAAGRMADGSPARIRYEDGSPFNPADHSEYTFNATLKIRD